MTTENYDNVNTSPLHISLSGDLLIVVRSTRTTPVKTERRGQVEGFSESSRRRLCRYLRECEAEYRTFITLTYPPGYGEDGMECKHNLRRFMQELRRYTDRRNGKNGDGQKWSTLWFMEFQRSGRIHFHLLSTHRYAKDWISRTWYRIVGSDEERHLRAGTNIKALFGGRDGARRYAAKYTYKMEQKKVPDDFGWVGRFWGVYGNRYRVSATTTLSPELQRHLSIERQLFKLKGILNVEQKRETIKKLPQISDRAVVFHVSSKRVRSILVDWIMRTNILRYANVPDAGFWHVPELDDSIVEDFVSAGSMH